YDPATDTWRPLTTSGAPSARAEHVAVWSGRQMVVWGGHAGLTLFDPYDKAGGRYDPATDTWTPTSTANVPVGRGPAPVAWTGSVMVIWGGFRNSGPTLPQTGGRYDPVLDRWTPTSTVGAPSGRQLFSYVWSGHELIVWGGVAGAPTYLDTGG